jgi:hypothetical protein
MTKQLYKYNKIVYTPEQFEEAVKVVRPLVDLLFKLTPSTKNKNWSSSHSACAGLGNLVLGALRNSNKKIEYWEKVKSQEDPSFSKDEKGENEYLVACKNYNWNCKNSIDLSLIDQLMTHAVESCVENLHIQKSSVSKDKTAEQVVAEEKELEKEYKKFINFNI